MVDGKDLYRFAEDKTNGPQKGPVYTYLAADNPSANGE
jgi:hypothetical protein